MDSLWLVEDMHSYMAYGLCLHSDLALPGLPAGRDGADVYIRLEALDEATLSQTPNRGERIFGHIYQDIVFLVEGGTSIIVDVRTNIDEAEVRAYVMGVLMAILLRQRGLLALHACCVARDGRALGFVGESGWGKSTLAEHFCTEGYELINDDILAIRLEEEQEPLVVPGYPQVRLRPESGAYLRNDFEALPRVYERTAKRISQATHFSGESVPLAMLCMLEPDYTSHTALERLKPGESLLRLTAHTRVTHLFHYSEYTALHLQQCTFLVRTVPIYLLHRVRSLDMLPEILTLIENKMADIKRLKNV